MLDFDASKLLIIGVVALVVIGPKDLPRVLRQVGQMVTRLRRMAGEFQGQFMDAMKEADLQELREEVSKLKDTATLDVNFDPVADVRNELNKAIDTPAIAPPDPLPDVSPAATVAPDDAASTRPVARPDEAAPNLTAPVQDAAESEEAENAAFRTVAEMSGAVGAPVPPDPARRRKIVVPKRRAPGDRLGLARAPVAPPGRSRFILPPRREPQA